MKRNTVLITLSMFMLIFLGLLMIYSSSNVWALYKFNDSFKFFKAQFFFFMIGLVLLIPIIKMDIMKLKKYSNVILIVCLVLLGLVLIPGIGQVRNGSRSWFGIGPFGIQPSEFSKIGLIIFNAKYLARNKAKMKSFKDGLLPLLIIIILTFLLIMVEPDFGTAFILIVTSFIMLFTSNSKYSFFLWIIAISLLGFTGLIIIAPYRLARILSFLNPWSDPLGSGFQMIQSLYAIGPGGLFGQGLFHSRQKHFYLPEPQTDFIFSIISEEFGFLGILLVISLFTILFYNILMVTLKETDYFKKYLCFGFGFLITFQAFLNLAITSGLLPVTGVTLPFLSYGGSSLLISMISIGIVINISKNTK